MAATPQHREAPREPAVQHDEPAPSSASQRGLDWLNFLIADVQTGFGPFVALYLASEHWSQGGIGLVLTVGGLVGILSQVPGGALVDWVPMKRMLVGGALAAIAAGALIFALFSDPAMIFLAEVLHGSTAGIIEPAMAAIGLGLVGHRALGKRLGRNQRFDSLGNAATAAAMAGLGQVISKQMNFVVAAALCLPAAWALTRIRGSEIDYARARSARRREKPREALRPHELCRNRDLLIFIGSLALFQFVDASLMPLATGRLGTQHQANSELLTGALVVVPQLVTVVIAAWVARRAEAWGRKPLLIVSFAVEPIRAAAFALVPSPWFLVGVQVLDGIDAAVIGILMPLVIADVTRGTGRYNLAQGTAGTATGIGASLSTVASGYAAQFFGYDAAFFGLAAVGVVAVAVVLFFLRETQPEEHRPEPAIRRSPRFDRPR
ncbi:MAG: MFS transporter [Stellaceae bacterium]